MNLRYLSRFLHIFYSLVMSTPRNNSESRATFATRLGAVAAAVGSAVGLGNIWRFPYEVGDNGGGAFLLIYIFSVILLGMPLLIAEFVIGRSSHSNVASSFRRLKPGSQWYWIGVLGILVAVFILGFYVVVLGWTLYYTWLSLTNGFPQGAEAISQHFGQFTQSPEMLAWMLGAIVLNAFILLGGVQKGIERASRLMMPLLAILLLGLVFNSFTLDNASEGLKFLFMPDFSRVNGETFIDAMGQAFFSLSVAMGIMIAYGSYLGDNTKIGKTALQVSMLDTVIAILAGVVIFPACFTYFDMPADLSAGMPSDLAGPSLVFKTLPIVFQQMPGGYLWCLLFFLLITVAGLTSCMSIFEVPISFVQEVFHVSRRRATWSCCIFSLILGLCCLPIIGNWVGVPFFGDQMFDFLDTATSKYMMPVGAFLTSLFVGWRLDKDIIHDAISNWRNDSGWYLKPLLWLLRVFAPICILLIFLGGIGVL